MVAVKLKSAQTRSLSLASVMLKFSGCELTIGNGVGGGAGDDSAVDDGAAVVDELTGARLEDGSLSLPGSAVDASVENVLLMIAEKQKQREGFDKSY